MLQRHRQTKSDSLEKKIQIEILFLAQGSFRIKDVVIILVVELLYLKLLTIKNKPSQASLRSQIYMPTVSEVA